MRNLLLTLLFALTLSACSFNQPREITVEKVTIVHQKVPPSLLKPCTPPLFLDKPSYMTYELYDREKSLTLYILDIGTTLSQCNNQLTGIRSLNNDNKQENK